jgi:hypothetical protein
MIKNAIAIYIACFFLSICCSKNTSNEGEKTEETGINFDSNNIIGIVIEDLNGSTRRLSNAESGYLITMMSRARITGIAKLMTPYSIKVIDANGNEYKFKTNGKKFAEIGTDIFYEFIESIDWVLEKKP